MTIQQLFIQSNIELTKVVMKIKESDWDLKIPSGQHDPINLREAINYHCYDDAWVFDVLEGKTIKEVGIKYDELLTHPNIQEVYANFSNEANEAVNKFDELTNIVHLSYGDYSAKEYLQHITCFRAFRSYDIAKLTGQDTKMDAGLVNGLLEEYGPLFEEYRTMGIFGQIIEINEDSSLQERLLSLAGRS